MKKWFLIAFIGLTFSLQSYGQILSSTLSTSTASLCDTVNVAIVAQLNTAQDYFIGSSFAVSGSTITITVNVYICTGICQGVISSFATTQALAGIPPGTYSVVTNYNTWPFSSTSSLTITNSTLANAGPDTSLCNETSYQLSGNAVPVGVSAIWTVVSGSGTITNPTMPNATVTNLSFGVNKFLWTVSDTICTTNDEVKVTNYEMPSAAQTESNRFSCYDTTTISATALAVGSGEWKALPTSISIYRKNRPSTSVSNLVIGNNEFEWTVSNGVCPQNIDTLIIQFDMIVDTPTVSINGSLLTSSSAPEYQWYFNQSPILNATNQTHMAQSNGLYAVKTHFPDCTNGLISEEIELNYVGIEKQSNTSIQLYPNPTKGIVKITGFEIGAEISVINSMGKTIKYLTTNSPSVFIEMNGLTNGVYYVQIFEKDKHSNVKLILNK